VVEEDRVVCRVLAKDVLGGPYDQDAGEEEADGE
jgi:hypothetical protein